MNITRRNRGWDRHKVAIETIDEATAAYRADNARLRAQIEQPPVPRTVLVQPRLRDVKS